MPRIPDADISRLKQAVALEKLAERKGCRLERAGADEWRCLCPFHAEDTPSLHINTQTNVFHCFGCEAKGDVVQWVRLCEGISFPDAIAWLQAFDGGTPWAGATAPRSAQRPQLDCPLSAETAGDALLTEVAHYYASVLHDDPLATAGEARRYLESRKLWAPDVLRRLGVGFDDRSLGTRLPHKALAAGRAVRARLTEAGLYRASGHAHFVGCVTFPIEAVQASRWVSIYGRRTQKAKDGIRHVNLPGPRRGVWNAADCAVAARERGGAVILCEAVIDALTFVVHGHANATACLGTNGYTEDLRAFLHAHARAVYLAFDRDDAGDAAFPAIAEDLIAAGLTAHRVQFPPGLDANAVAVAAENPAEALAGYVRHAVWLGGAPRVAVPELPAAEQETLPPVTAPAIATAPECAASPAAVSPPLSSSAAMPVLPAGIHETADDTVSAVFADRRWTARGWRANTSYERLKVALRVQHAERVCGDQVDVASLKQRAAFVAAAAAETGASADVLKEDLGKLWLALEHLQDRRIREATAPAVRLDPVAAMPPERRDAALALLRAPDLLERIRADVSACGLVGESDNALVAYLAAVSRKLPDPLAVLVQATSAAGKSSLQDTVLSLIPDDDRYDLTAISSRALFYAKADALRHKALSIAEQEGAESATYSLKLMQSAGKLSIMVPVKDPETNEMTTQSRTVDGPVAIFMTTTAAEIDEELQNRFLVLTVDESAQQTAAVQAAQRQRETREGFLATRHAAAVRALHHDAQHLLEQVRVFNPFAPYLTFAGTKPRTRRDHAKYLRLIRAITFLRQHQRERKTELIHGDTVVFIETTAEDIADANRLAGAVLGRSLDELAPQTRRLMESFWLLVQARAQQIGKPPAAVRVTRRELREQSGWSYRQIHIHLTRLVEMEYALVHRGSTTCSQCYELAWDGAGSDGSRFVLGLSDPSQPVGHTPTAPKLTSPSAEVYRAQVEDDGRFTGVLPAFDGRFTGGEKSINGGENRGLRLVESHAAEKHIREQPAASAGIVPVGAGQRHIRMAPLAEWG